MDTTFWVILLLSSAVTLLLYWLHFSLLSRTAKAVEQLARIAEGESGRTTREVKALRELVEGLAHKLPTGAVAVADDDAESSSSTGATDYDAARIPKDRRWYALEGSVGKRLVADGLVTKGQLEQAYRFHADKGGHVVDHLFAMAVLDEAQLRTFLGKAGTRA